MLLAALASMDARQVFICHKELFHDAYRGWSEARKGYVGDCRERECQVDKVGALRAPFAPEPDMTNQAGIAPEEQDRKDAEIIGPWSAVRRKGS